MEAYKALAKRLHPDVNPEAGAAMRDVNAAYAELRRRGLRPARRRFKPPPGPPAGYWLSAEVRDRLGPELTKALQPHEPVLLVAGAATWDSLHVRLVVTDRRLLWLRDDAIGERIKRLPFAAIERVEARRSRTGRRGELRVQPKAARRVSFAEMRPELLDDAMWLIEPRLRARAD